MAHLPIYGPDYLLVMVSTITVTISYIIPDICYTKSVVSVLASKCFITLVIIYKIISVDKPNVITVMKRKKTLYLYYLSYYYMTLYHTDPTQAYTSLSCV